MRRLILRPGAIGDCLLALPALEHLASGDHTELWISSAVAPLIHFADRVQSLSSTGIELVGVGDLPLPPRLQERLANFDSIVSWYGANRPEFRRALNLLGVDTEFLAALPPNDYPGHATDFFAGQVGARRGLIPRIELPATEPKSSILLHPFSGSSRKNWPLRNYRDLAARLPEPVEWAVNASGIYLFEDLGDLAGSLNGTRLFVGNDSGITHLAAALGVPTLALFGPTDPARWAPRGPNVTVLHSDPLENLTVDQVRETANRLLNLPQR